MPFVERQVDVYEYSHIRVSMPPSQLMYLAALSCACPYYKSLRKNRHSRRTILKRPKPDSVCFKGEAASTT